MTKSINISFETNILELELSSLIPNKILPKNIKDTPKFLQIYQTIKEIGIIEPIVVHPITSDDDKYIILDGHIRHRILMEQGFTVTDCLITRDDEAYTYNKRINRLSSIQEHFMILEAIKKGVSEDKIAKVLNVNISTIRKKRDLLSGICPDVINLIKNISIPADTIRAIKRVKPIRQLEIINLLNTMGTFKADLAKAMVKRTPENQFASQSAKVTKTNSDLQAGHDINNLIQETNRIKEKSGSNLVKLVAISSYLSRLLDNKKVRNYIDSNYSNDFKKIEEIVSIVHPENTYENF